MDQVKIKDIYLENEKKERKNNRIMAMNLFLILNFVVFFLVGVTLFTANQEQSTPLSMTIVMSISSAFTLFTVAYWIPKKKYQALSFKCLSTHLSEDLGKEILGFQEEEYENGLDELAHEQIGYLITNSYIIDDLIRENKQKQAFYLGADVIEYMQDYQFCLNPYDSFLCRHVYHGPRYLIYLFRWATRKIEKLNSYVIVGILSVSYQFYFDKKVIKSPLYGKLMEMRQRFYDAAWQELSKRDPNRVERLLSGLCTPPREGDPVI